MPQNETVLFTKPPSVKIERGMVICSVVPERRIAMHPADFLQFLVDGRRVMAAWDGKGAERIVVPFKAAG